MNSDATTAFRTATELVCICPDGERMVWNLTAKKATAVAVTLTELADGTWFPQVNQSMKAAGKPFKYGSGPTIVVEITEG